MAAVNFNADTRQPAEGDDQPFEDHHSYYPDEEEHPAWENTLPRRGLPLPRRPFVHGRDVPYSWDDWVRHCQLRATERRHPPPTPDDYVRTWCRRQHRLHHGIVSPLWLRQLRRDLARQAARRSVVSSSEPDSDSDDSAEDSFDIDLTVDPPASPNRSVAL